MSALARLGLAGTKAAVTESSQSQQQTGEAFGFKWAQRDSYESPAFQSAIKQWLIDRYCGGDVSVIGRWLAGGRKLIVDAGCGAGNAALLLFCSATSWRTTTIWVWTSHRRSTWRANGSLPPACRAISCGRI